MEQSLEALYRDWFKHPEWWFDKHNTYDTVIIQKYGDLVGGIPSVKSDFKQFVGCVIANDQLPHHMFRGQVANHIIQYFLQKSQSIASLTLALFFDELHGEALCFTLLPFRHTKQFDKVLYATRMAWIRLKQGRDDDSMKRFLKASYNHMPPGPLDRKMFARLCLQEYDIEAFQDILYNKPSFPDLVSDKDLQHPIFRHVARLCNQLGEDAPIVISLSGGVDSMVLSYALKRMNVRCIAVHVNYKNKDTCNTDEAFVSMWCHTLGIPLVIRRIVEIQRKACMEHELRDLYEEYTRRVRFDAYRRCYPDAHVAHVFLGHNQDDCLENILTNIAYQQKYECLHGMTEVSPISDGLQFVRPMLTIPKSEIRTFAQQFSVPHLFDSTPSWSQRGKIRDSVIPAFKEWDPRIINGLLGVSEMLSQCHRWMQGSLEQWVAKTVAINTHTWQTTIEKSTLKNIPMHLFRDYVTCVTHNKPSLKSIVCFYERMNKWLDHVSGKGGLKAMLKKGLVCELSAREPECVSITLILNTCE